LELRLVSPSDDDQLTRPLHHLLTCWYNTKVAKRRAEGIHTVKN